MKKIKNFFKITISIMLIISLFDTTGVGFAITKNQTNESVQNQTEQATQPTAGNTKNNSAKKAKNNSKKTQGSQNKQENQDIQKNQQSQENQQDTPPPEKTENEPPKEELSEFQKIEAELPDVSEIEVEKTNGKRSISSPNTRSFWHTVASWVTIAIFSLFFIKMIFYNFRIPRDYDPNSENKSTLHRRHKNIKYNLKR